MTYTSTAFELGQSVVSVWPRQSGVIPGTKILITRRGSKITAMPIIKKISGYEIAQKLGGVFSFKKTYSPQELNESYDQGNYQ